jgi:hypothetical protein
MQSFIVHAFGPPSPEVLAPPLSGRVSGGNVKGGGPPSAPPLDDGDAGASSALVASPDGTPESSGARGLPPPLPLPPPDVEHATQASFSEACGSPPPAAWLLADPDEDDDVGGGGLPFAAQLAGPRATSTPNSQIHTVTAPFFCGG